MINIIISICAWIYITSLMFSIGLRIPPVQYKKAFSQYSLIGRVLLINSVIIPLLAWLFTAIFQMGQDASIGFILVAVCAGSPFSPRLTERIGGDFLLSVSMTIALILISIISVPITIFLISFAYPFAYIHPFFIIIPLLIFQLAPIILGSFIRHQWENIVEKILKPLRYVIIISLLSLLILSIIFIFLAFIVVLGSFVIIASIILISLTAILGFFLGGPKKKTKRSLVVTSMTKDAAAAILIITINAPEADRALAAIISFMLIGFIIYILLWKLFFRKSISEEVV